MLSVGGVKRLDQRYRSAFYVELRTHCGLDSNTCIQNANNLSRKIAYVEAGLAGTSLLGNSSAERQRRLPGQRSHPGSLRSGTPPGSGRATLTELWSPGPEGQAQRQRPGRAAELVQKEKNGLRAAMSQRYAGRAVYLAGEKEPFEWAGRQPRIRCYITNPARILATGCRMRGSTRRCPNKPPGQLI